MDRQPVRTSSRAAAIGALALGVALLHAGGCAGPAPRDEQAKAPANASLNGGATAAAAADDVGPDVPYYETLYQVDMIVERGKARHPNYNVYTRARTPGELYAVADDLRRRNPGISGILVTFFKERVEYDNREGVYRFPNGRVETEEQFERQYGAVVMANYVWDEDSGEKLRVFPFPDSLLHGKLVSRPK
jgi:hypothetical protein